MPASSLPAPAGTAPRSGQIAEVWARCRVGEGLPTRSRALAGRSWWPVLRGSAYSPRSGFPLQGEGSLRPYPLGSTVVHAGGASRSTSVAPDLDAIAARSRAGQGTVHGEQATGAGSVQRGLLYPRPQCRTRHLSSQDRNLVAKHDDFDGEVLLFTPREPNQLERTDEGDVEEGECHAPSSSSVSRQQKSRPMSPDDVFGTHRAAKVKRRPTTRTPDRSRSTKTSRLNPPGVERVWP